MERGKIKSYRDLIVWQKSYDLCLKIYEATRRFPGEEKYGLVSQIRRAAVSIPSNIAEGQARGKGKEFIQFLRIAYGSTMELHTQISLARDLNFLDARKSEDLLSLAHEVELMLAALMRSLKRKIADSKTNSTT